ncbi:signal peptidase II [Candidatus Peregrinibacteria bacterium]|nr:MAG: signal peptidase II [Candidatus Peregrinibacteria bacterium]
MNFYKYTTLFTALFVSIIDITSKNWAQHTLENNDILLFGSAQFTLKYNHGIAFSLPLTGTLQIIVTLFFLCYFLYWIHTQFQWKYALTSIGSGMVFGGAIGNMTERVTEQGVTDFIQVTSWSPVFNLADSFIFIGVCCILFFEWKYNTQQ